MSNTKSILKLFEKRELLVVSLPEDHWFDPKRVCPFPRTGAYQEMQIHYCFAGTVADLSRKVCSGLVNLHKSVSYEDFMERYEPWLPKFYDSSVYTKFAYDLTGLTLGVQETPTIDLSSIRCYEPTPYCNTPSGILATSLKSLHDQVNGNSPVQAYRGIIYRTSDAEPYKSIDPQFAGEGEPYSGSFLYPTDCFRNDCNLFVEVE